MNAHMPPPPKPPPPPIVPGPVERRITREQWLIWWLILAGMTASCVAWLTLSDATQFLDTGIFFVLVPGSIAAVLALVPVAEDQPGFGATRGVAIVVLCTALLVREGFVCVLMAMPIVIPVALFIHWLVKQFSNGSNALLIPLLLVSFGAEGIAYDIDRDISAAETRVIEVGEDAFSDGLEAEATLPEIEPLLFALPFPKPIEVVGHGAAVGDVREVRFEPGGTLELTVADRGESHLTWEITRDTTPMSGWMAFKTIRVDWVPVDHGLELTLAIDADRKLAPSFYFGPLQRFAVGEMAEVLIDMLEVNSQATAAGHVAR